MTHEESFVLRWIEWNTISPPLIEYVWALTSAGKGSPQFRNVFGGVFAALISPPEGVAQYSSMPSIDDIATRYGTAVEVISEENLLAGGETKLTYSLQVIEDPSNNEWYGPPNGLHPLALFSAMEPIAQVPSSSIDFLRLSLLAAGLPSDVSVEEVRFKPDRALAKTFKVDDVVMNRKTEEGALLKENVIKYYSLVPGNEPEEIPGWD